MEKILEDRYYTISLSTFGVIEFCVSFSIIYVTSISFFFVLDWINLFERQTDTWHSSVFTAVFSEGQQWAYSTRTCAIMCHRLQPQHWWENYCRGMLFLYIPVHNSVEKAGLIALTVTISGTIKKVLQIVLFWIILRIKFTSGFSLHSKKSLPENLLRLCGVRSACVYCRERYL